MFRRFFADLLVNEVALSVQGMGEREQDDFIKSVLEKMRDSEVDTVRTDGVRPPSVIYRHSLREGTHYERAR